MSYGRIELLRRMPAFGGLKQSSLESNANQSRVVTAAAGDFFFREGEPGDSLFVLEAGTVVVQRKWQGQPIVLGQLGLGDCFGEMALIDLQPRSARVKAETDCEAIEITTQSLRSLYQQDLEQYAMIMMNLGREVSRRLRVADESLFQLQQFSYVRET